MKLRNFLLLTVFGVLLCGCSKSVNYDSVEQILPGADVKMLPSYSCSFLAKMPNGDIYYVFRDESSSSFGAVYLRTNLMFKGER